MGSDLINLSIYLNRGRLGIFDKSDLTLELVRKKDLVEFLMTGNYINNLKLNEDGKLSTDGFKAFKGSFCTENYVAEIHTKQVYYYINNMKYTLHFSCSVAPGMHSARTHWVEVYCGSVKIGSFIGKGGYNCIVPLKDGLVISMDGDIGYRIGNDKLSRGYGEPYSTLKRMKEVILG